MKKATKIDRLARGHAQLAYEAIQRHEDECKEAYKRLDNAVNSVQASVSGATITMQQTTDKLQEVNVKLEEIRKALLGDDFDEHPGLIRRVKDLERAIHGDDEQPTIFIKRQDVYRYIIVMAILSTLVGGGFGATAVNLVKLFVGG